MKLYFCIACRKVHHDNDYSREDGDLEILDWDAFLKSVEKEKERRNEIK